MALFKRKDKTTIAELEDYYANQKGARRPVMAWVMALLSLLVTIIIIVGLFYAGRWLYQTIADGGQEPTTTTDTTGNNDVDLPTFDGALPARPNNNNTDTDTEERGVVSDRAATTTNNGERTSNGELPDTGAGSALLIALPLSVAAGYGIARRAQLKNSRQ